MNIFSRESLRKAWNSIHLSKTPRSRRHSKGSDGISVTDFKNIEDTKLEELYISIQGDFFRFSELESFFKKRPGKSDREIQVPTVSDRIIQKVLNDFLVENYFIDLFKESQIVGSVKGTNLRDIIQQVLRYNNQGFKYVLKTDIINYFPSINTKRLRKILSYHIKDKKIKALLIDYTQKSNSEGIAQGPPLSPLMANLYLLSLDKYLSKRKNIRHFRYVDDILVFCRTENEAKKVCRLIDKRLKLLGLDIHPLGKNSKTIIDRFDSGSIDALGIIYNKGRFLIKSKKVTNFRNEVINPINRISNLRNRYNGGNDEEKVKSLIKSLNYRLIGWGGSYNFCDESELFKKLDISIEKHFFQLLDKTSIKDTLTQRYLYQKIVKLSSLKTKPISRLSS